MNDILHTDTARGGGATGRAFPAGTQTDGSCGARRHTRARGRGLMALVVVFLLSLVGGTAAKAYVHVLDMYYFGEEKCYIAFEYDILTDDQGGQYASIKGIGATHYINLFLGNDCNIPSTVNHEGKTLLVKVLKSVGTQFEEYDSTSDSYRSYSSAAIHGIVLPSSGLVIEEDAFSTWDNIDSHSIMVYGDSIANNAFDGCRGLPKIDMLVGAKSIGDYAFRDCANLKSIAVPDGVTSLGQGVFKGCTSLESIYLQDSLTAIGDSAFQGCTSLRGVYYTGINNVRTIGKAAFADCSSLPSVGIGDSVTAIGDMAFMNCTALDESIYLPESVTAIGDSVFWGCTSLRNVTIGDNVQTIGKAAFAGCSSLSWVGISCSVIGDSIFRGCTSLGGVAIGDKVQTIGKAAFADCSSLSWAGIGSSVTAIGDMAFMNCTSLGSIELPKSVQTLGTSAFNGCAHLFEATLGDGLTHIGMSAFENCTGLYAVHFGSSLIDIERRAFYGCTTLPEIVLPASVTSTGSEAFHNCKSLVKVTISNSNATFDSPFQSTVQAFYMKETHPHDYIKGLPTSATINVPLEGYADYKRGYKDNAIIGKGPVTVSAAGYATFYVSGAYYMPEGLEGAVITGSDGDRLDVDYRYAAGDEVPENTGVLLKGEPGDYDFEVHDYAETGASTPDDNWLRGSDYDEDTYYEGDEDVYFYKLSYDRDGQHLGFYWGEEGGQSFTSAAHRAYLVLPVNVAARVRGFRLDGGAVTGIGHIATGTDTQTAPAAIYTLDDRRVNSTSTKGLPAGIYVVDGKKTIVK